MKIGIVGLGLIGGSFAKALKKYTDHTVVGVNRTRAIIERAYKEGAIDEDTDVSDCDAVLICLYPDDTLRYMQNTEFKENAVVADACGVKRYVGQNTAHALKDKNVRYVGTHPMAGKEISGFGGADADLFADASFIITRDEDTDAEAVRILSDLAKEIGFSTITLTDAKKHDEVIGYTSQLAHVVSNAYVKSKAAEDFEGFSAGSFMDLTRVAKLNPQMWAELFTENKDILVSEIDELIENIKATRDAIDSGDRERLAQVLKEGSDIKEELIRREHNKVSK